MTSCCLCSQRSLNIICLMGSSVVFAKETEEILKPESDLQSCKHKWKQIKRARQTAALQCSSVYIWWFTYYCVVKQQCGPQPDSMQQHWPSTSPNKGMKHPESKHTACVISHQGETHPLLSNKAFHTPCNHSYKQHEARIHVQCDGALLSSRVSFPSTVQILV